MEFTVSADATRLTAFKATILGEFLGANCPFSSVVLEANPEEGFKGEPIVNNMFLGGADFAFSYAGRFTTPGMAEGILEYNPDESGCESLVLPWTATTP